MKETLPLHTQHERLFESNRFVYPVLSRRSGGVSIGVNLNPDKVCNFDCVYCQVDRTSRAETKFVETDQLLTELRTVLELAASGRLFDTPKFQATPAALRRLNDIALSGDGEPTTYKNFDELIGLIANVKQELGLSTGDQLTKIVLITNASMFHRPHVARGLELLDKNQGEIWAKLDAGTEAYYQQIERTKIPMQQVLDNIATAAKARPLVVQSLFLRLAGEAPSAAELDAYCDRLNEVTRGGGQLRLIQIYTVARRPAESVVTPLADEEVDAIVERVRQRTGLCAEPFYGSTDW